jgi:hypothetical protein
MTDEVPKNGDEAAAPPPVARTFRKSVPSSLTPEQCKRQTDVLRAACEHLVPRGAAIAFLNAYNKALGGNPLQLALGSDEGLLRVEKHLASASRKKGSDPSTDWGTRS